MIASKKSSIKINKNDKIEYLIFLLTTKIKKIINAVNNVEKILGNKYNFNIAIIIEIKLLTILAKILSTK